MTAIASNARDVADISGVWVSDKDGQKKRPG
jgi:hypothetical protein